MNEYKVHRSSMKCVCGHLEMVHVAACFVKNCWCKQFTLFQPSWADMEHYAWIMAVPMADDDLLDCMESIYAAIKEDDLR